MSSHKTTKIVLAIIALIIIGVIIYFLPSKTIAPENNVQNSTTTAPTFTYTTKTINENSGKYFYSIKASYPVFSLPKGTAEKNLNANVAELINDQLASYRSSYDENSVPAEFFGTSTLEIAFTINQNNRLTNILPIRFNEDAYNAGAAHPGESILTANYDLTTGQAIHLSDIFKPGSNYLKTISDYSISALKQKLGSDASSDDIQTGASPDEKNFDTFLITDTGLDIIFNEYQVASYAAGSQEVLIPWPALSDILNPSFNLI